MGFGFSLSHLIRFWEMWVIDSCIDPLGAYIKRECRGLGVGKKLLYELIAWSGQQDVTNIHVDFESANYHANQFWLNYFTPVLYSVKRRLNNDVI